jgi:hypothetical protein
MLKESPKPKFIAFEDIRREINDDVTAALVWILANHSISD